MNDAASLLEEINTLIGVLLAAQQRLNQDAMPDLTNFDVRVHTLCQKIEAAPDEAKANIKLPLHNLLSGINSMGDHLTLWKERHEN